MLKKISVLILITILATSLIATLYFYRSYIAINKNLEHIIRTQAVTKNPDIGYSFISNYEGTLLWHPIVEYANKKVTILFAQEEADLINALLNNLKEKKEILIKKIYDDHGHLVQLYLIEDNKNVHGLIFFPDELRKYGTDAERHILIIISLSILFGICALLLLFGIFFITKPRTWWYIVAAISIAMIAQMSYLWSLRDSVGFQEEFEASPLITESQKDNQVQKINSRSGKTYKEVPTGIFIDQGQFANGNSSIYPGMHLGGYIWQQYDLKEHADLERGFIIPNAHSITIKELYRQKTADKETICWSFSANLYQKFNPLLYPFDRRHILINLLHKNFEKNVLLVPDFPSYQSLNPLILPGVSLKSIILSYWNITKSFFSFNNYLFKTNLGSPDFYYDPVPYLQFYITAYRKLGGDFIMYFVSLIVVLIILFIQLLAFLKQESLMAVVGFSTFSVLGACSGLLFVLITSEICMRQALMVEGIIYLEYLYFVSYAAIIMVIINSILFAVKSDSPIIAYENNLIFKLIYWPLTLLAAVLVTAYILY